MTKRPLNVDGVRRLLNVSPAEMSDAEIRRALAILASDYDRECRRPTEVAAGAYRFAEFMNRASLGPL